MLLLNLASRGNTGFDVVQHHRNKVIFTSFTICKSFEYFFLLKQKKCTQAFFFTFILFINRIN